MVAPQDFLIKEYLINRVRLVTTYPDFLVQKQAQPSLLAATRQFGQIHPFLVVSDPNNEQLVLLTGFSQYLALLAAEQKTILCRLVQADTDPLTLYGLRILHDQAFLADSIVLQAYLLREAEDVLQEKQLVSLLPLLGLKAQSHLLVQRKKILTLSFPMQEALHRKCINPKSVEQLLSLPPSEQEEALALISHYNFGGSKQQKLMEMLVELQHRSGIGISELLHKWRQAEPPDDNIPQEGQNLLSFLQKMCTPKLTQAREHFASRLRELKLPAQARLSHTADFEDEGLELHLSFANWENFTQRWPALLALMGNNPRDF